MCIQPLQSYVFKHGQNQAQSKEFHGCDAHHSTPWSLLIHCQLNVFHRGKSPQSLKDPNLSFLLSDCASLVRIFSGLLVSTQQYWVHCTVHGYVRRMEDKRRQQEQQEQQKKWEVYFKLTSDLAPTWQFSSLVLLQR